MKLHVSHHDTEGVHSFNSEPRQVQPHNQSVEQNKQLNLCHEHEQPGSVDLKSENNLLPWMNFVAPK